jgi:hypothetical protein
MSVGEEEDILAGAVHVEFRVVLHGVEVQRDHKIGAAKRAAGVAALHGMHHTYDIAAYLRGDGFDLGNVHKAEGAAKVIGMRV